MLHDASPQLSLHGVASLEVAGARLLLERKFAALLCVLAVDGATGRGALAAMLWPDVDAGSARRNLRQRIFKMHRLAGCEIVVGRHSLQLADGIRVSDVAADDAAVHGVDVLRGFDYEDVPEFAAWLATLRRRHRDAAIERWSALASAHEAAGELAAAIVLAQRVVAADGVLEHGHRRLMRLHYLRGDGAGAIAAFERCEATLRDELGARPNAETLALLAVVESSLAPRLRQAAFVPVAIRKPPRLLGRDGVLAELGAAWRQGCRFVVVGEAGMGKSRLLAEYAATIVGVVAARSRPGDASVPLAALEHVLRALLSSQPTVGDAQVRGVLAALVPEWSSARTAAAPVSAAGLRHALARVFASAMAAGVSAILIDDLQFADRQSLDVIEAMFAVPELADLRWGFAMRPEASMAAHRFGAAVSLPPLNTADLAELLSSLKVEAIDTGGLAAELSRHTGGNPMFVLETLKHMLASGSAPDRPLQRLPRPASVTALIEVRLRLLSPAALALARVAAIAAPDFSIALAESVLGARAVTLADAWAELEAAQVLRGVAFAHDLIYETAFASVPEVIAAHLHQLVARALEAGPAEPARIAAHWEGAGDAASAAPHWLQAARAARARGSAIPAAELCERACDAYDRSGQADAAFDALCLAAEHLSYNAPTAEFGRVVERLVARANSAAHRARAWFWRAHLDDLRGAPIADVEAALRDGLLESIASAQPRVEAEYRYGLGMVARRNGQLQSAAEQFAAAATLMDQLGMELEANEARTTLGGTLAALGRLRESSRWLGDSAPVLKRSGAHNTLSYNRMRCATNAESAGSGEEAARFTGKAIALLNHVDPGAHDWCVIAAPLIDILTASGRYAQALALAGSAKQRLSGQTLSRRVMVDVATAQLYLCLGRPEQAMQMARFTGLNLDPVSLARVHMIELLLESDGRRRPETVATGLAAAAGVDLRFQLLYVLLTATGGTPVASARALSAQIVVAEQAGMWGFVPALQAALARQLALGGDAPGALAAAGRAVAMLADYSPATSPPALHHDLMETYRALGMNDDAQRAAQDGARWLHRRLRSDVPDEFRDSIQQRNPVHRALLLNASKPRI